MMRKGFSNSFDTAQNFAENQSSILNVSMHGTLKSAQTTGILIFVRLLVDSCVTTVPPKCIAHAITQGSASARNAAALLLSYLVET